MQSIHRREQPTSSCYFDSLCDNFGNYVLHAGHDNNKMSQNKCGYPSWKRKRSGIFYPSHGELTSNVRFFKPLGGSWGEGQPQIFVRKYCFFVFFFLLSTQSGKF